MSSENMVSTEKTKQKVASNRVASKKMKLQEINPTEVELIIEAALFVSADPLSKKQLKERLFTQTEVNSSNIDQALVTLTERYLGRGVELVKVASGYRFQTNLQYQQVLTGLSPSKPVKISQAMLETLSLIAYKQPITRAEIEEIRGVAVSSYIIKSLHDRNWIKTAGHKEVPGRPVVYATTKEFLDYFGLTSLAQLPEVLSTHTVENKGEEDTLSPSHEVNEVKLNKAKQS